MHHPAEGSQQSYLQQVSSIPILTVELRKQKLREIEGTVSVTRGDTSPSPNHYDNFSSVQLHKHRLHLFFLHTPCWEALENVWSFQPGAHLVPITFRWGLKIQAVP